MTRREWNRLVDRAWAAAIALEQSGADAGEIRVELEREYGAEAADEVMTHMAWDAQAERGR